MKSIGIDTRMMNYSGIGTYIRNLVENLDLNDLELKLFGGNNAGALFEAPIYSLKEQLQYPSFLKDCDLWHAPHYNVPLIKGRTRLVVTIHDLIHWIFRKDYFNTAQGLYAKFMLSRAISLADKVITVSENTKADLVRFFKADPNKIVVIYEAVETKFLNVKQHLIIDIKKKLNLPNNYFIYVGNLKPHKQVDKLIRVHQKLRELGKIGSDLVIVGKKDKHYSPKYKVLEELKTGNGIHYFNFVADPDLISIYNNSLALIHPSRYEGFGLTLLEAMASGTSVVASRAASIPEVVGDAALLVDPDNDHDLEEALVRIERDKTLREDLIRKGAERVQNFSWKKMAMETMQVYEEVLSR